MNIIIEMYMFVCAMLLLFDIIFLVIKNIKNHRYYPQDNEFKKLLQSEFENYTKEKGLGISFKEEVANKIKKTKNLVILQNQLEAVESFREEISLELRPYIFNEIDNYKEKSDYEQAYYTYVISKFDYSQHKADNNFCAKFITFLDSESLYTFTNTMNAIYSFGDHNLMFLAISKVNERSGFYHKKLFVDGLLTFTGDIEELTKLIKDKFYSYAPGVQESLLDYFRMKNIPAADLCADILRSKNIESKSSKNKKADSQVLYSAMRYFAKFPDEESKNIFMDILQRDNEVWLEQMLAIQGLKSYKDSRIKALIKRKITSPNWYVRTNALSYLHYQNMSKEEIFEILSLKDKYANEALLYEYKGDEKMSKYILDTLQSLEEQEIKDKAIKEKDIEEKDIEVKTNADKVVAV